MKKSSTVKTFKSEIFKDQKLTIGVDLGDRWSFYCVWDEAGKIILEQKVPTTPEAMKQTFFYRAFPSCLGGFPLAADGTGRPKVAFQY